MSTLLRVEGVNHANCLSDSEDLATRRGGGLMLLDAIQALTPADAADAVDTADAADAADAAPLRSISTGASVGLFEIVGDAATARQWVEARLARPLFHHGTFMIDTVDIADIDRDFQEGKTAAIAANRWRQMRSLSFSPVGLSAAAAVCAIDGVRPAGATATVGGAADRPVSVSVAERRRHGNDNKRRFHQRAASTRDQNFTFTRDFEDIAVPTPGEPVPSALAGKIAVFYADGNRFGEIARACKTPAALRAWDRSLKQQRQAMLAALLDHAAGRAHWKTASGALRLETLLWGGDELMMVVPARCGLELAEFFFARNRDLHPPGSDATLSHACGLVFCHHQAPISRISALAADLANRAKDADRDRDLLNWLVLESFDHAGDLDDYLERRFASIPRWPDLALAPAALSALLRDLPPLKEALPRSALIEIVYALAQRRAFDAEGEPRPLFARARERVTAAGGAAFAELWSTLDERATAPTAAPRCDELGTWLKLAELWDYCPPHAERPGSAAAAEAAA